MAALRADWALHHAGETLAACDRTATIYMPRWHAYNEAVSSQRRGWPGNSAQKLLDEYWPKQKPRAPDAAVSCDGQADAVRAQQPGGVAGDR